MNKLLNKLLKMLLMMSLVWLSICPLAFAQQSKQQEAQQLIDTVDEKDYVGNVYGFVRDAVTGGPLKDAEVVLITEPLKKTTDVSGLATKTNKGWLVVPEEVHSSPLRGTTNEEGHFLINSVPTPFPSKNYTIIARVPEYDWQIIDQVPVLPGSLMALEVTFSLSKNGGQAVVFAKGDAEAPFRYRHEKSYEVGKLDTSAQLMAQQLYLTSGTLAAGVYATREGLVGGTTANGHVIQQRDWFAALPSRKALASNWSYSSQVRISYNGRSVTVPVWDVGPHNSKDDYWNPSSVREMWKDLPQFMPEAQAAFYNGYNGGKDQYGGRVQNPAGIDIADGAFWDGLGMTNNDWVTVEYLFASAGTTNVFESDIKRVFPGTTFDSGTYWENLNWGEWELRSQRVRLYGYLTTFVYHATLKSNKRIRYYAYQDPYSLAFVGWYYCGD